MKYLRKFKLYENILRAKSILKSKNIDENNYDYNQLLKIFSKNHGYIGIH